MVDITPILTGLFFIISIVGGFFATTFKSQINVKNTQVDVLQAKLESIQPGVKIASSLLVGLGSLAETYNKAMEDKTITPEEKEKIFSEMLEILGSEDAKEARKALGI